MDASRALVLSQAGDVSVARAFAIFAALAVLALAVLALNWATRAMRQAAM